jgi:hypothetical protein
MEGGNAPRFSVPRICRSPRFVALAASSILSLAANWAIADDAAALRPLARRYADPAQLFEAEEEDIEFKQVVVAEKSFRVPPPATRPIRFAMEEPPAFVSSAHPTHYRFEAAGTAPALSTLSPPPSRKISQPPQNEPQPVAAATQQPSDRRPASPPPSQNYQRPFPLSAQRPADVVVQLQPQPVEQTDQVAGPAQAIQNPVATPPQSYQRPFPLSAQRPPQVVVRIQPQPVAQPDEAAALAEPAQTLVAVTAQAPAEQHPVVVASDAQAKQPQHGVTTSPEPASGRVVMASSPSDDVSAPPVRFSDGEPPVFLLPRLPQSQPVGGYLPVQPPPHMAAPIPVVMTPAESPSLTIPAPPTADMVPDVPAFSSTADPLNITIGAVADQPPPPAPGVDASAAAAQSGAAGSFGQVEKLGDAPTSSTLEFLRQEAILLKPGEHQVDWGLSYSVYNLNAALPVVNKSGDIVGVANERIRLQLMTIPFAVRYGLCDGLQAYVNLPLGWSNDETTTDTGESHTNNFVSMGDISAGLNYQIMKGCGAYVPDVIASLGFIAPTGHATFATSLLAPNSALGQGFWDITASILAVHTIDPVIFYYGAGYVHRFDASFGNNLDVDPGQEFDYVFGVGFAANPWVVVSGTFIGNYLTRYGVNGVSLPGSDLDLMRFRVSVTMVKDKHIIEPYGEIGMTPDSPSRVGITFTY